MSRWFVYVSVVVGAFFVVQRAAEGSALYVAFLEGCAAAAALMLLAALGYRLHRGDRLRSVQLPAAPAPSSSSRMRSRKCGPRRTMPWRH